MIRQVWQGCTSVTFVDLLWSVVIINVYVKLVSLVPCLVSVTCFSLFKPWSVQL